MIEILAFIAILIGGTVIGLFILLLVLSLFAPLP
jgi:hypothetical protein